jgi:uroporphyrinogen-III decarboxylase
MEFTPKRRLLSAIKGQETDYTPFSPFLAYYFDFLPQDTRNKGDLIYLKEMGADPLLRGALQAYSINHKGAGISDIVKGGKRVLTRSFKKGRLISEYTYSETAKSWFLSGHPVKSLDDLNIFIEMMKETEVRSEIDKTNESIRALGEDGLQLAVLGMDMKSAFQNLMENWLGTENLIYFCMDYPDEINEALRLMNAVNIKTVEYTAASEASACLSWEDSSTTNINPSMYREYIMPEISKWCALLGQAGKPYIQHACGHIKDLLPFFAEQGNTSVESISPPPTGNVTVKEADAVLPKSVSIIGGIEATHFLNDRIDKLLEYVEEVLYTVKGRGFVLSNSDSCPPGVEYEKFIRIAQFVKSHKRS